MPKVGRTSGPDPQQSQLGYLFPAKSVTAGAPFGNDHTEKMRMKLVAGKPELIMEDNKFSPRQAPPTPVREKRKIRGRPFDQNNINTYPKSLYDKDKSKTSGEYEGRHSRQLMSPYKVVPPINPSEYNGDEPLPSWPIKYSAEKELELKKKIQGQFTTLKLPLLKQIYMKLTDKERNKLTGIVPFSTFEAELRDNQVSANPKTLRMVSAQFVEPTPDTFNAVNYEKILGYIHAALTEVEKTQLQQTRPQETPVYQTSQSHNDKYYTLNPITYKREEYGANSRGERDIFKLLEKTKKQLEDPENTTMLEFESVVQKFRNADRGHRGKLASDQIMQIVFECGIPLDHQTFDQILDRVCKSGNGQYDWVEFLNFLEKVYPSRINTGLQLSKSKRPTEYVKQVPEPSSSWPHGSSRMVEHHHNHPSYDNYDSPRKASTDYTNPYNSYDRRSPPHYQYSPDQKKHHHDDYDSPRKVSTDYTNPYNSYDRKSPHYQPNTYEYNRRSPPHYQYSPDQKKVTEYSKNYVDPYDRSESKQSQIESINDELKRREEQYLEERNRLLTERDQLSTEDRRDDKTSFKSFTGLIDTLYRRKSDYTGTLPVEEADRIIRSYNREHNLKLSDEAISKALNHSLDDDSRDYVLLDSLALKLHSYANN